MEKRPYQASLSTIGLTNIRPKWYSPICKKMEKGVSNGTGTVKKFTGYLYLVDPIAR